MTSSGIQRSRRGLQFPAEHARCATPSRRQGASLRPWRALIRARARLTVGYVRGAGRRATGDVLIVCHCRRVLHCDGTWTSGGALVSSIETAQLEH